MAPPCDHPSPCTEYAGLARVHIRTSRSGGVPSPASRMGETQMSLNVWMELSFSSTGGSASGSVRRIISSQYCFQNTSEAAMGPNSSRPPPSRYAMSFGACPFRKCA